MFSPISRVLLWPSSKLSSFGAGALLWTCIVARLWGAQGVEIVPNSVDGVPLEGPGSAGFHDQFITAHAPTVRGPGGIRQPRSIPPDLLKDLLLVEPYTVRFSNGSTSNIVKAIIRYEFLRNDGHLLAWSYPWPGPTEGDS
ncbi:MAG TPA: hypothetical protein VGN17_13735 [Bryobacteraceae bacterium]|jgi:hypothetical protein